MKRDSQLQTIKILDSLCHSILFTDLCRAAGATSKAPCKTCSLGKQKALREHMEAYERPNHETVK